MRAIASLVKRYKEPGTCLGSINPGYWLSYVYAIGLGGANVHTIKIGCLAITPDQTIMPFDIDSNYLKDLEYII